MRASTSPEFSAPHCRTRRQSVPLAFEYRGADPRNLQTASRFFGLHHARLHSAQHSCTVTVNSFIPVPTAQRRSAVQRIARVEQHARAGIRRLEPPMQAQLHAARRIEQRFLHRYGHRPQTGQHLAPPQHLAALLLVPTAGLRQRGAEHEATPRPSDPSR